MCISSADIHLFRANLKYNQKSVSSNGSILWNSLPPDLKNFYQVKEFINKLDIYFNDFKDLFGVSLVASLSQTRSLAAMFSRYK